MTIVGFRTFRVYSFQDWEFFRWHVSRVMTTFMSIAQVKYQFIFSLMTRAIFIPAIVLFCSSQHVILAHLCIIGRKIKKMSIGNFLGACVACYDYFHEYCSGEVPLHFFSYDQSYFHPCNCHPLFKSTCLLAHLFIIGRKIEEMSGRAF